MRRRVWAAALLALMMVCTNTPAKAQGQDPVVGIAHNSSDDVTYAVSAGGSAYRGRYNQSAAQTTWVYDGEGC